MQDKEAFRGAIGKSNLEKEKTELMMGVAEMHAELRQRQGNHPSQVLMRLRFRDTAKVGVSEAVADSIAKQIYREGASF